MNQTSYTATRRTVEFTEWRKTGRTIIRRNLNCSTFAERAEVKIRVTGDVVLTVDVAGLLLALGNRALRSKGKRAVSFGGMVRATVRNAERVETPQPPEELKDGAEYFEEAKA